MQRSPSKEDVWIMIHTIYEWYVYLHLVDVHGKGKYTVRPMVWFLVKLLLRPADCFKYVCCNAVLG